MQFKKTSIFFAMACLAASLWSPQSLRADEPLPTGEYRLTGIKIDAINRTKTAEGGVVDAKSDKLTHWIRFDLSPTFEVVKGSEKKRFKIEDPVTEMTLKLDKPIKLNEKAIAAGTDLFQYKKFDGKRFNMTVPKVHPLGRSSARIKRDFDFPNDVYNVTFECKTKSGKTFSDTIQVTIDVKLP